MWSNLTESNTRSADSASFSRGLPISGGKHWSDLFDCRCPVLSFGFCVWVGGFIPLEVSVRRNTVYMGI